ncbi:MAG: carbohydrate kinase family protein [Chloroflexia bacterium]
MGQDKPPAQDGVWAGGGPAIAADRPRIAAVGDLVLDVLVRAESALVHGSDVRGAVEFAPGGSAANFAVWAARQGADVRFLGAVGDDFIGDHLLEDLRSEGVVCAGVARLPGRSPSVFASVGMGGERSMVTDRRATLRYGPEHVRTESLAGVEYLHVTAYSLFDAQPAAAAFRAVELARTQGCRQSRSLVGCAARGARRERTRREIALLAPDVISPTRTSAPRPFPGRPASVRMSCLNCYDGLTAVVKVAPEVVGSSDVVGTPRTSHRRLCGPWTPPAPATRSTPRGWLGGYVAARTSMRAGAG